MQSIAREAVHDLVANDGYALLYLGEKWQRDPMVVLLAVRDDGTSLAYAATELKHDLQIVLAA
eukprot:3207792-Amphidinium_carterae.1